MIYFVGWWIHCDGSEKTPRRRRSSLLKELQTRFDVSAESALDIIEADKTLSG
ncbi:Hypothetical protein FKW44_013734 [Caligus rogercresseyi]|uniref:Uncharacterized protein n=1 Tax=Caligus rogercresseyi TaxID=217165 RepID=A0A7T8JZX2_CALRO|nr:Hypothetical protein FKW44_013734 [Caligus rogercresseyi]